MTRKTAARAAEVAATPLQPTATAAAVAQLPEVLPKVVAPKKAEKPAAAVEPVPVAAHGSAVKTKLVRDSFTMPRADFALIAALKERTLVFKRPTKKSELLRAGLQALAALDDAQLQAALEQLVPIKTGRPKKH